MSEADLLAAIDLFREDDSRDGRAQFETALAALLARHEGYIYGTIKNVLGSVTFFSAADVYWNVVDRVIRVSGTFSTQTTDAEAMRLQFLAWLGRVAELVVREALRGVNYQESPDDGTVLNLMATPEITPESPSASRMRQLMEQVLTPREQEVLWAWTTACPLDGSQARMEKDDIEALCRSLDTTPTNIRKIRSRALEKLRNSFEQNPDT